MYDTERSSFLLAGMAWEYVFGVQRLQELLENGIRETRCHAFSRMLSLEYRIQQLYGKGPDPIYRFVSIAKHHNYVKLFRRFDMTTPDRMLFMHSRPQNSIFEIKEF